MSGVESLGAQACGVWTRREALQVLSPGELRQRLAGGQWQAPWPGVYADAGHELDHTQRAFAAVLAGGGQLRRGAQPSIRTFACGRTAARVHGLMLIDDDDPATATCDHLQDDVAGWTHGRSRHGAARDRILHRRHLVLRAGDVVRAPSGLWLTCLPRTLLDCAALLTPEALVCLLDDLLHRGRASPDQLAQLVHQRAGQPGVAALRQAVADSDGRSESPTESLARLLLLPRLPHLVPQVELRGRSGSLLARFDLADKRLRLAVELDGRRGHAGDAMVAKDRRRDRHTRDLGWATERGTWFDVRCRQREFVERVVSASRAR